MEPHEPAAPASVKRRKPRPSADGILGSAEEAFARHGYARISLRQLMSAAGVSTTAFYARFASKEAVLLALVDRLLVEVRAAAVGALAASKEPEQIIALAVEAMVASLADHRDLVAIALTEGAAVPEIRDSLGAAYEGLVQIIAGRLEGASESRHAMAWAYVGSLQIQVMRWAVFRTLERQELERELINVSRRLTAGNETK